MDMRMMSQRRSPGVQNQRGSDLRSQMPGVGRDRVQCLCSDVKEQSIDHRLVGVGNCANGGGQGEDHVIILHGQ